MAKRIAEIRLYHLTDIDNYVNGLIISSRVNAANSCDSNTGEKGKSSTSLFHSKENAGATHE